jgi:3-phosphoglycerate kinase
MGSRMAFTSLLAEGQTTGRSLLDPQDLASCGELIAKADGLVILLTDFVTSLVW